MYRKSDPSRSQSSAGRVESPGAPAQTAPAQQMPAPMPMPTPKPAPAPVQMPVPVHTHYPAPAASPIYQANSHWCEEVRKTRRKLAGICGQCTHRYVRVQTIDGHTYEGTVMGTDGAHLQLAVQDARFFGPYAGFSILTLVLYELLVITLLI